MSTHSTGCRQKLAYHRTVRPNYHEFAYYGTKGLYGHQLLDLFQLTGHTIRLIKVPQALIGVTIAFI